MTNEQELQISNKSYINKDFPVIYTELLDKVKELTESWDPETSNEADPGIVLMKLMAFIADKLNYNADKNVLERFMLSATQASSMRELCDMMGFSMEYYMSSQATITFSYIGDKVTGSRYFKIPKFSVISSADGSINFVTKNEITVSPKNRVSNVASVVAVEGTLNQLTANGDVLIRLTDLDDNNRIYFPVSNVAENGVFITTDSEDKAKDWNLVNNLNAQALNQRIYKFGFDSDKKKAYIEFPEDIANLIENGLYIQYLVTQGKNGNVPANTLTVLSSPSTISVMEESGIPAVDGDGNPIVLSFDENEGNEDSDNGTLIIKNASTSLLGSNPMTIDEAYNGFKKTIGTFDTLVTCRDYANYIYNLKDNEGFPLVSNVQVTDRRDDYNWSTKVYTFGEYGPEYVVKVSEATPSVPDITPYDLCLYTLTPLAFDSIHGNELLKNTLQDYVNSYIPLLNSTYIQDELEESKTMSHTYKNLSSADTYYFRNDYILNANITTTHKVGSFEQADILTNIKNALINNFNARKVDYGYEIPYDTLFNVIKNADSRISVVSLMEPEIDTYKVPAHDVATKIMSTTPFTETSASKAALTKLVSKNVLAGRVSLYDFDTDFRYDFSQSSATKLSNLKTIKTEVSIPVSSNVSVALQPNEVVQLIAPSYLVEDGIGYSINFSVYLNNNTTKKIPKNKLYTLQENEYIYFNYGTSDGGVVSGIWKPGTIIKANFEIWQTRKVPWDTEYYRPCTTKTADEFEDGLSGTDRTAFTDLWSSGKVPQVVDGENRLMAFYSCGSKEELNILKKNEVEFTEPRYCYWITSNTDSSGKMKIKWQPIDAEDLNQGYYCLLNDGEYFYYTDNGFNVLSSVGSGTTLKVTKALYDIIKDKTTIPVELTALENNGLLQLKNKWEILPMTSVNTLSLTENTILTLTEGDRFSCTLSSSMTLNNEWKEFTGTNFVFEIDGTSNVLDDYSDLPEDEHWRIRSRLNVNAGRNHPQIVYATPHSQYIKFTPESGTALEIKGTSGQTGEIGRFELNLTTQLVGDDNIDVSEYDVVKERTIYPLTVYKYAVDGNSAVLFRDMDGYALLELTSSINEVIFSIPKDIIASGTNDDLQIMVYWQGWQGTQPLRWQVSTSANPNWSSTTYQTDIPVRTMKILSLKGKTYVRFSLTTGDTSGGSITFSELKVSRGYNKYIPESIQSAVNTYVSTYSDFYRIGELNNDVAIRLNDHLDMSSPFTLYDSNNIANKITLSRIDFDNSIIEIARSSRQ